MNLEAYEAATQEASFKTFEGAALESERVYYSARDPLRYRLHGRQFEGKISRGTCIDCAPIQAGNQEDPVPGLRAEKIGFSCLAEPTAHLFRRKGNHRGNRGLLTDEVRCEILVSWDAD